MFRVIARIVVRLRWVVVAAWVIGLLAAVHLLPSIACGEGGSCAGQNWGLAQTFPAGAPSLAALRLDAPLENSSGQDTAVIVAVRSGHALTAGDDAAMRAVERAVAQLPGVGAVHDEGTSADGEAAQALVVTTPVPGMSQKGNPAVVAAIRGTFHTVAAPAGLALHLTGPLAITTDHSALGTRRANHIETFALLVVIVLLIVVLRAALAPLVTLLPALASVFLAGRLIGVLAHGGFQVVPATQGLLIVLLIGAGTDYGVFLVFRMREEVRRGAELHDALVTAMSSVGQAITLSALTLIAALASLAVASFGLYRGIGPALAVGLAVVLLAALTLLPALLAIAGRALFWPSMPSPGKPADGWWGRIAARVVHRPGPVLAVGVAVFGALALGLHGFAVANVVGSTAAPAGAPAGSDSALGSAALAAHFPAAGTNADALVLRFASPIWTHPADLTRLDAGLTASKPLRVVASPLEPNGTALTAAQLARLYDQLGPATALPAASPPGGAVSPRLYAAYRSTARFVSADGRTVRVYAVPAGAAAAGSQAAIHAIPAMRRALETIAHSVGAQASGVAGPDAEAYDIEHASASDLGTIVPIVLAAIALVLALMLRSLVAPIYLILTVGLSYVASLGFATIVFLDLGREDGISLVIPILVFIFVMALGEDYNILLMSRVREEIPRSPSLREAVTRAVSRTGGTITSAGLILAGTFTVLGFFATPGEGDQLGLTVAFGVLLDTFFVRTLLVPSIAVLLGRWNWWPSALARAMPGR